MDASGAAATASGDGANNQSIRLGKTKTQDEIQGELEGSTIYNSLKSRSDSSEIVKINKRALR